MKTSYPPRRIAIVTIIHNLSTSPSLLNAISVLAGAGYQIDIIGRGLKTSMPRDKVWENQVHYHLSPWVFRQGLPGLTALRHLLLIFKILWKYRPLAVIAVSPETLVLAGPVAILLGLPLIHFSLEIRYPINLKTRIQKQFEKLFYHFVQFTIIQDEVRARALLDSNCMERADFIYVPNVSGLSQPPLDKSDYLRQHWCLPKNQKIILSAGNISHMTCADELILAAKKWPENWTLIVHGWSEDTKYLDGLRELCDGHHVILSEELVSYENLDLLVNSADIGIALYNPIDPNVYNMAKSSGKIWQYLRCSLPVITMDFPSLQEIVSEGQFGLCVHCLDDVQHAIEQVLMDYSVYAIRAREYYCRYGDFAKSFQPILARIESLHRTL